MTQHSPTPDKELRTKIAEDLIAQPLGTNTPLSWDLEVLIDYISAAKDQLLTELMENDEIIVIDTATGHRAVPVEVIQRYLSNQKKDK